MYQSPYVSYVGWYKNFPTANLRQRVTYHRGKHSWPISIHCEIDLLHLGHDSIINCVYGW